MHNLTTGILVTKSYDKHLDLLVKVPTALGISIILISEDGFWKRKLKI